MNCERNETQKITVKFSSFSSRSLFQRFPFNDNQNFTSNLSTISLDFKCIFNSDKCENLSQKPLNFLNISWRFQRLKSGGLKLDCSIVIKTKWILRSEKDKKKLPAHSKFRYGIYTFMKFVKHFTKYLNFLWNSPLFFFNFLNFVEYWKLLKIQSFHSKFF